MEKSQEDYVDKEKLYEALKKYKQERLEALSKKLPVPRIPEYIGECIYLIAENYSHKYSFSQYPFRDEMVADGVENCIRYMNNFDPDKSNQPFSYFTKIIHYAFIRRIDREKKHLYTKFKALENNTIYDELSESGSESDEHLREVNNNLLDSSYMKDFVEQFEVKAAEKKEKRLQRRQKDKGLEDFYDDE